MQGDIFQMEQLLGSHVQIQLPPPSATPKLRSKLHATEPQAHIYNEDDLSHLLYVDEARHPRHHHHHQHHHQHHFHSNEKILINDPHHDEEEDATLSPPEFLSPLGGTGTHTPASGSETPVLSDCDSDLDTGAEADNEDNLVCPPSPPLSLRHRRNALAREDGFEFPVFLGRQAEDDDDAYDLADDEEIYHKRAAWPLTGLKKSRPAGLHVDATAAPTTTTTTSPVSGEDHVSAIDGPMMSWWPAPVDTAEHEWVTEKATQRPSLQEISRTTMQGQEKRAVLPERDERHEEVVSEISGPLMTWWPAPLQLLEHEWVEAFYE